MRQNFSLSRSLAGSFLLASLLGAAACSGVSGTVAIEVRSPEAGDARNRLIAYGGTLSGSDRYAITVNVKEPLYLYAEQRTEAGISQLYPSPGFPISEARPGTPLVIPPGSFLKLGGLHGTAWIYVVASNKPIDMGQARFEIDKAAGSSGGDHDGEMGVGSDLDERGIGVLRFKLVHR